MLHCGKLVVSNGEHELWPRAPSLLLIVPGTDGTAKGRRDSLVRVGRNNWNQGEKYCPRGANIKLVISWREKAKSNNTRECLCPNIRTKVPKRKRRRRREEII